MVYYAKKDSSAKNGYELARSLVLEKQVRSASAISEEAKRVQGHVGHDFVTLGTVPCRTVYLSSRDVKGILVLVANDKLHREKDVLLFIVFPN